MQSDIESIEKAVKAIKETRPVYAPLLDYYGRIFAAQEKTVADLDIEPIRIPESVLDAKRKERLPLIMLSEFRIDRVRSQALLATLCAIAEKDGGETAEAAAALLKAVDAGAIDPTGMFGAILEENDSFFAAASKDLSMDKKVLLFFAYNSIKPSVSSCAEALSVYLEKTPAWEKGYCPVCGSPPGLGMFREEGKRSLICSFCWHEWPAQRIYCPFCENRSSKTLNYFAVEGEKGHRVDLCDRCKKYIKTVDTRELDHFVYPPLEQVTTLHLDMKAVEAGYRSGRELDIKG